MEKIGFINRFIDVSGVLFDSLQRAEESAEQKNVTDQMSNMLAFYKEAASWRDVDFLLSVENMMLRLERDRRANAPEEKNSINTALIQLAEAQQSLAVVKDCSAYRAGTETYSSRHREAGLPMDSFREFIKSHTTRLTNRLSAPLSVPEKNLLRQRKENLKVAKEVYISMQREALGLPSPKEKDLGLER